MFYMRKKDKYIYICTEFVNQEFLKKIIVKAHILLYVHRMSQLKII